VAVSSGCGHGAPASRTVSLYERDRDAVLLDMLVLLLECFLLAF